MDQRIESFLADVLALAGGIVRETLLKGEASVDKQKLSGPNYCRRRTPSEARDLNCSMSTSD